MCTARNSSQSTSVYMLSFNHCKTLQRGKAESQLTFVNEESKVWKLNVTQIVTQLASGIDKTRTHFFRFLGQHFSHYSSLL